MKPLLILNCCARKNDEPSQAISLYKGALFSMLPSDILERFELAILSAEYGLINSNAVLSPYEQRLPKRFSQDWDRFIQKQRPKAEELLNSINLENRHIFVICVNDYLAVFDQWSKEPSFKALLDKAQYVYASRGHRGIGVLKSRLKTIIKAESPKAALASLNS
ncbi:hypothetical protein VTH8203_01369 [Vibrio thalassae]|uniref:DUF6884 domain-containing protein n=1 Tax=Vibrio thalassae TaxID=1243014 RepID=A0A240EGF3_9VIBR|nr:DUF6884 domain-containing protein [Vibrio thalassae]SNX47754.1 hypothetical protein VTH8203_01369 [Vibrio thalassae]